MLPCKTDVQATDYNYKIRTNVFFQTPGMFKRRYFIRTAAIGKISSVSTSRVAITIVFGVPEISNVGPSAKYEKATP